MKLFNYIVKLSMGLRLKYLRGEQIPTGCWRESPFFAKGVCSATGRDIGFCESREGTMAE